MNAQPNSSTTVAPDWSGWLNSVINGTYPLHRLLSGSDHGAVFLTESQGRADPKAAVKIIPIERVTLAQLSHWKSAIGLSHPHLIQLLDAGLCQLEGQQFLFVVMEYAEQTLSEVLRQRALTLDEVRELLPPTLGALTFLHDQGLVHAHLKPSNILVVDDQLKLSSDGIHPADAPRDTFAEPSLYDPPEVSRANFGVAGDIWSLGISLVEALTQSLPRFDAQPIAFSLPTAVPPVFADTVQRCLSPDPDARPSARDLGNMFDGAARAPKAPAIAVAPAAPVAQIAPVAAVDTAAPQAMAVPPAAITPDPKPVARDQPRNIQPKEESQRLQGRMPVIAAIVCVVFLASLKIYSTHSNHTVSQPLAAGPRIAAHSSPAQPPASVASVQSVPPTPAVPAASSVVHAQLPRIPRKAFATIHGHFEIVALVVVDHSGSVISEILKSTGPSPYFARLTREAAKEWKFSSAAKPSTREWTLHFEFTRNGVTGSANPGPTLPK